MLEHAATDSHRNQIQEDIKVVMKPENHQSTLRSVCGQVLEQPAGTFESCALRKYDVALRGCNRSPSQVRAWTYIDELDSRTLVEQPGYHFTKQSTVCYKMDSYARILPHASVLYHAEYSPHFV
jgi:hypothetical protein